jgi:polysaccharide export outer membrane protein
MRGQQAAVPPEHEPEFSVGLVPGDTVEVFFLDFPEAAQQHLTVSSNGTLFVPYAGQVKVLGMTPDEAQQAIIDALKEKQIVNSPQVSLNVVAARNLSVLVMGQVALPHPVPLTAPAPLSLILDQTGGFTANASYRILIVHKDGTPPTSIDMDRTMSNLRGLNEIVKPGDIVSVAQAGTFYALGELNHPGVFPLTGTQHMTLLHALAIAGGPGVNAALSRARILRATKDGSREEIEVDLAKLEKGKVVDPLIEPDDILYVPKNSFKVIANSWLNQSLYAIIVARDIGAF